MHFELLKKISTNGASSNNGNLKNGVYHDIIKLKNINQNIMNKKQSNNQKKLNNINNDNNNNNNNSSKKKICHIKQVIAQYF
jgi:hypothetical protein